MCLCLNESSLGLTRNRDTSTAADLEHPLVTQHAQGSEHRIRVDTQHRSHVTSWREPVPGRTSPLAMSRRISAATCSCSWRSRRSSRLTGCIVTSILSPYARRHSHRPRGRRISLNRSWSFGRLSGDSGAGDWPGSALFSFWSSPWPGLWWRHRARFPRLTLRPHPRGSVPLAPQPFPLAAR